MSAETASGNKVIAMALNNTESLLIAMTDTLQIMSLTLKGATSKSNKGKLILFHHFHEFFKVQCTTEPNLPNTEASVRYYSVQ